MKEDIDCRLSGVYAELNSMLSGSDVRLFNQVRAMLHNGHLCFSSDNKHLSKKEREGLRMIRRAISNIPILSDEKEGKISWYIGEDNVMRKKTPRLPSERKT